MTPLSAPVGASVSSASGVEDSLSSESNPHTTQYQNTPAVQADNARYLHTSHSQRRRILLKINDLSHIAFANIKSIESITYAFYATGNGQVLN